MNEIDLKREDYCCDIMESTTRKKDRFIMHLNLFVDKIYYDQASKKSQLHFQVIVTVLSKIDEKLASLQIYPGTICSKVSSVLLNFEHWVQPNR